MLVRFEHTNGANPYIATSNKKMFEMFCNYYTTQLNSNCFVVNGLRQWKWHNLKGITRGLIPPHGLKGKAMYKNFKAEWTGSYPCLCSGEWKLTAEATEYDEERGKYSVVEDISHLIPADLRKSPMFCEGTYDTWYFDEDYIEIRRC